MKVTKLTCPNCGAPINKKTTKCEWCGTSFIFEEKVEKKTPIKSDFEIKPRPPITILSNVKEKPVSKKTIITAVAIILAITIISIIVGCVQTAKANEIPYTSSEVKPIISNVFLDDLEETISILKVHNNNSEYCLSTGDTVCSYCNSNNTSIYGIDAQGYNTTKEDDIFTIITICNDCHKELFQLKQATCEYSPSLFNYYEEYPELFPDNCPSCGHYHSYRIVENRYEPDINIQITDGLYYGASLNQIYFLVCEDCSYISYILQEQLEEAYNVKLKN